MMCPRLPRASRALARRTLSPILTRATFAACLLAAGASAQNLLQNPSFEPNLANWNAVTGTATVVSYDAPNAPIQGVATRIGGGNQLVRDSSGNAVIEQIVNTGPLAPGTNVRIAGYVGGSDFGDCGIVVRYLGSTQNELARDVIPAVTANERNRETVLMLRERVLQPVAGTTAIAVRLEFHYNGGAGLGMADNFSLELTTASTTPAPLPLDTQLLVNGDFESGWNSVSPLTLTSAQGWFGNNGSTVGLRAYAPANPGFVPPLQVSSAIGGGGNLLGESFGGDAQLFQRLDVRGNATAIDSGALAFRVSAYLGGLIDDFDNAEVFIDCRNESNTSLRTEIVGPITRAQRNGQSVLMLREEEIRVPAHTTTIYVVVTFDYTGGNASGLVDNVVAKLVAPTPIAPVPLGVNVIDNGTFEEGFLGSSPLQLTNPSGWEGINNSTSDVIQYELNNEAPSLAYAKANGFGALVLSDGFGGSAGLAQEVDLRGMTTLIQAHRLRIAASVFLGGVGADSDSAQMQIQFLDADRAPIAGGLVPFPPVTAAERGNVTMLVQRPEDQPIPATAAFMRTQIQFNYLGGSVANGLVDNVSVVIYDTLVESFPTCAGDGSFATCPCGNNGASGHGCANSTNPAGALLGLSGSPLNDDVTLLGSGMPATSTCIYFQGDAWDAGGAVFGDGLRCAAGTVIRLKTKTNAGGASQFPQPGDPSVSLRGLVTPGNGDVRLYQAFYRNSTANFCPPQTFNVTNAWVVVW